MSGYTSTDGSGYKISARDYHKVVFEFNSRHDNRTTTIAKLLDLSVGYTSYIIDFHLSMKKNYMGTTPVVKNC